MIKTCVGDDLQHLLPHRGPALMIDGIIHDDERINEIIGRKIIQANDPWLEGHFPDMPIYPGHCQIECVNLTAAALIKMKYPELEGKPIIAKIDDISFKTPARPGDTLSITVLLTDEKKKMIFTFTASIRNQRDEVVTTISEIKGINNPKM